MGIQDDIDRERAQRAYRERQDAFVQRIRIADLGWYWADLVTPVGRWKELVDEILPVLRQCGDWVTEMIFENGDGGVPPLPYLVAFPLGQGRKPSLGNPHPPPAGSRSVRYAKVQYGWQSGSGYFSPGSPMCFGLLGNGDLLVDRRGDGAAALVKVVRGELQPGDEWWAEEDGALRAAVRQWVVQTAAKQ